MVVVLIGGGVLSSFGLDVKSTSAQVAGFSECDDGIDNDGDSFIDYPRDMDCFDFYGSEEAPVSVPPQSVVSPRVNDVSSGIYTYRIPGTYNVVVPDGMNQARVKTWGAGGGGGSGIKTKNQHTSGFGGGGGGYAESVVVVTPGSTITVVVGRGGMAGEGGGRSEASALNIVLAGAGGGGGGLSFATNGLSGYGLGDVRGGLGGGLGGEWIQSVPSRGGDFFGPLPTEQTRKSLPLKIIAFITQAKQLFADAFQPVGGGGGSGYVGSSTSGAPGGSYSTVGGNPYASSGGAGANGGAGGERGRTGRDGGGHCGQYCSNAKDGNFPGGGGGGSDTGVGGFGADGQVSLEFIAGPVTPPPQNTAPVASLTCPASLRTGEAGSFVGRGTDADAGDTLSYTFNWGGGATDTVSGNSSGTDVTRTKSWPTAGTYTVQFSVTDSAGLSSATNGSCVVTVTTGTPLPLVTIDAQPRTVPTGGATVLAWSATDAQSCNAYSVPATTWTGAKATSGNNFPVVINQQTSFWLSCTGPGGVGTNYVTVFTTAPTYQCSDSIDNDGDGTIDYPADSGCTGPTDDDENLAPTASITGSTALTVGQIGTWNFSVADADANLLRWRFRAGTNPGAGWTTIFGSSRSGTYSQIFASPGTYTWIVDVEDTYGRTGVASLNVVVVNGSACPSGTLWNPVTSRCENIVPADVCPNIAGTQSSVPVGMTIDASGNCVASGGPATGGDMCPNITGVQSSVPTGMVVDASGNCVTAPVTTPVCPASYSDVTVTGVAGTGSVWGSGPYTDDSNVSRAAVHQGLISVGQTATISRTPAGYVSNYVGSTRNGVTTSSYGAYCGMTLSLVTVPPVVPTDLCPNIAGTQSSVPVGMTIDASGNCVASGPSLTPTLDFTADNYSVFFGLGTTLRWSSTNVTSCTASGNWSGSKTTSGSESTGGLWSDKTYTLMCTGPNGSVSKTIVINVGLAEACRDGNDNDGDGLIDYPADPGCTSPTDTDETDTPSVGNLPPVVNLSASPTLVYSGTGVYLVWNSTNATACTASSNPNVWSGSKALSSTENVYGLTQQTTFTLTCTGPGGSGSDSVTIYINPNPTPQCLDGLDNDGDSLIDWGTDPGCDSALDDDETDGGGGTGGGTTGGGGGGGGSGGGGGGGSGGGPVSTGMTLGGDTFVPVQFLGAMGSESGTAQLSVNPVGSFSSDVSVRVVSIVSRTTGLPVPVGTQVTYSFAGNPFVASPVELMRLNVSGQYINTSGSVGLPVKVKFSQQISEAYIVRFEASGGGITDTHDLVVDPSGVSPDFREI